MACSLIFGVAVSVTVFWGWNYVQCSICRRLIIIIGQQFFFRLHVWMTLVENFSISSLIVNF